MQDQIIKPFMRKAATIIFLHLITSGAIAKDCSSYDFNEEGVVDIRKELAYVIDNKKRIPKKLLSKIKSKASGCDWDLAFKLGNSFYYSKGVDKDLDAAFYWYKKSAFHGYPRALFMLGTIHLNEIKYQDFGRAREIFELLAKEDYAKAQYGLGYMYLVGKGVEKDNQKASYFLSKSAENGYYVANRVMGIVAFNEGGLDSAKNNFEIAASNGDSISMFYLGLIADELGGAKEAISHFRRSCEAGFKKACDVNADK